MRQDTTDLDLENSMVFDPNAALGVTERKGLIARLENVEAYILGADNADKLIGYWDRLRNYWLGSFGKASARVLVYSALREMPAL
jgi:hypothetical protein